MHFWPPLGYMASKKYPLLYLNMPKAGCTSIKNILYYIDNGTEYHDPLAIHDSAEAVMRDSEAPDAVQRLYKSRFTFTFVRHPLKRAYSLFNEKIHGTSEHSFPWVRDFLIKHYGARFPDQVTLEEHQRNFLLFLDFIDDSHNGRIPSKEGHPQWAVQDSRVKRASSARRIDFVGRVESFGIDIDFVLRKAGYPGSTDFPPLNEGPPPPYTYDDVVTDEIAAKGSAIYDADFRAFGYEI
jgi:hypothetical protein